MNLCVRLSKTQQSSHQSVQLYTENKSQGSYLQEHHISKICPQKTELKPLLIPNSNETEDSSNLVLHRHEIRRFRIKEKI